MRVDLHQQLFKKTGLSEDDSKRVMQCRGDHNRLGFAYQLAFVRCFNRFPVQEPLEVNNTVLSAVSIQLSIDPDYIERYGKRRPTISEHQDAIREYLGLHLFHSMIDETSEFLQRITTQIEQTAALKNRFKEFLRMHNILEPSSDTILRLIQSQRETARNAVYSRLAKCLSKENHHYLDALLITDNQTYSPLHYLKQPPGKPSPASFLKLTNTLEKIKEAGVLEVDISWINNNFQRSLARYARQCSLYRLRRLKNDRRYTVLTCFLVQLYQDTFDAAVQMHDKLMNKMYNKADREIDEFMRKRRRNIRSSLNHYRKILGILLDGNIDKERIQDVIFASVDVQTLKTEMENIQDVLSNNYSNRFKRVISRHSYLRQFAPALIKHIRFQSDPQNSPSNDIVTAVDLLNKMNEEGKYILPSDAPTKFIPKKLYPDVFQEGRLQKPAWECALLTALRDQVKSGNLYVDHGKRYTNLNRFFIPHSEWAAKRDAFFTRAGLPTSPNEVTAYLTDRINQAYDRFLERLPTNRYAQISAEGWSISSEPSEKYDDGTDKRLNPLKIWLGEHIRTIKLPDLLVEVDNDLRFSRCFMSAADQQPPKAQNVCEVLATIMAHASEIGPYTMARITEGISYHRMKHITDWNMHEETQREALALVVNAISGLDITKYWGDGTTSSSDGQRFSLHRKVLYRSYSHAFNDFALEFYNFVADNFAPYFSLPHECADRDAPFVLDGLLYNESDLDIQEHYTDTHGFTDTNFAAFAMYGKRFSPRIKGLQKYAIYYVDPDKDYGKLNVLLERRNNLLNLEWIAEQWDQMGHFYASLESGHATASTALKRLNGFTGKNHFYRANRELGRLIRTEYTLEYFSDPEMRRRTRRGLLKGEQVHNLARDIRYGHRGRLNSREWFQQKQACSNLTLVIACIIYWQAKEIHRVIQEFDLPENVDLDMLSHISPVAWENIILYGDYIMNRDKVRIS